MVVWKAMLGAGTPPVYAELINIRSDLQQGMVVWKAMLGVGTPPVSTPPVNHVSTPQLS